MKNKFPGPYIFYPVAVFFLFFAAEKISLIPSVKKITQGDATFLYFDYKDELMDEMKVTKDRILSSSNELERSKKIVVILGSSRLLYFDYSRFKRNFPDRELFNFSAPVTAPAYYYYILDSLEKRGVFPDYILVETDPFQYNDASGAFLKSNLAYSFDLSFILRNQELFSNDEISYFLGRWLFASYKYSPDIKKTKKRIQDPNDPFLRGLYELDLYQRNNRGAGRSIIPRENWYERDFATLEFSSRSSIDWLYSNYTFSQRQLDFLIRTVEKAKSKGAKVVFVRPPASRPLQKILDTDPELSPKIKRWEKQILDVSDQYSIPYLDLVHHDEFYCNTYVDGAHMSLDCYHPFMVEVMKKFYFMDKGQNN
ncbi:MAG: DUF1574 domain-containing protein [Spirochaetia bacterium]|nr:DUF1574 domain-containing protein [Spirochaetia bacterium]